MSVYVERAAGNSSEEDGGGYQKEAFTKREMKSTRTRRGGEGSVGSGRAMDGGMKEEVASSWADRTNREELREEGGQQAAHRGGGRKEGRGTSRLHERKEDADTLMGESTRSV